MPKITKRAVDALLPRAADYFVWDDDPPGFGVRVWPTGRKVFVAQYRSGGRSRRYKIGSYGQLTVDQARTQARIILGDVARGSDPAEDRATQRASITMKELCAAYLIDAEKGVIAGKGGRPKKASTLYVDRGRIAHHIIPLLGAKKVRDVTRVDIVRFIRDVAVGKTAVVKRTKKLRGKVIVEGGLGTAARTAGLLGGLLSYAVDTGVIVSNPAAGVKRPVSTSRDRRLTDQEYARLGDALKRAPQLGEATQLVYSISLLALSGCRLGEVVKLRWSEVDRAGRALRFQDTKEGRSIRPLGKAALDLLEEVPRSEKATFVFPGSRSGETFGGTPRGWKRIAKAANLDEATLKTLRHSFASVASELGYAELTIAAMLGHATGSITARYVHQLDDILLTAIDRVSGSIASRMGFAD